MLSYEEEQRLVGHLGLIEEKKSAGLPLLMSAYDIGWLAKKLLEVNKELEKLQRSRHYMAAKYGHQEDMFDAE